MLLDLRFISLLHFPIFHRARALIGAGYLTATRMEGLERIPEYIGRMVFPRGMSGMYPRQLNASSSRFLGKSRWQLKHGVRSIRMGAPEKGIRVRDPFCPYRVAGGTDW